MVPASVPVLLAAAWTLLPSGAESDVAEVAFLKGSCLTGMLLPRNGEADMTVQRSTLFKKSAALSWAAATFEKAQPRLAPTEKGRRSTHD